MSAPFDLPNLDAPEGKIRALGIKNSGVSSFATEKVYPQNRLSSQDGSLSGGKIVDFRFRSVAARDAQGAPSEKASEAH